MKRQIGILFFGILLCGCATVYNPATGRQEVIMISSGAEMRMGREVHLKLTKQYELSSDEQLQQRVKRVGGRLAEVSDRKDLVYQFFVIEDKQINAFTTPGGNVYIYSGLVEQLTSDDQLAYVLAHEIGHTAARHIVKRFQAALGYSLISSAVFSQIRMDDTARAVASLSAGTISSLIFNAFSRQDEFEADRLAIRYMNRASFNTSEALRVLRLFVEETKTQGRPPEILSTHPYPEERIKAIERILAAGQKK